MQVGQVISRKKTRDPPTLLHFHKNIVHEYLQVDGKEAENEEKNAKGVDCEVKIVSSKEKILVYPMLAMITVPSIVKRRGCKIRSRR